MRNYRSLFAAGLIAGAIALSATQAEAKDCNATITQVVIEDNGKLGISTTGEVVFKSIYVCSLQEDVRGAAVLPNTNPPVNRTFRKAACEKMQVLFTAALLSGRPVTLWFTGDTCPTLTAWSDAYANTNQFYNVVLR